MGDEESTFRSLGLGFAVVELVKSQGKSLSIFLSKCGLLSDQPPAQILLSVYSSLQKSLKKVYIASCI